MAESNGQPFTLYVGDLGSEVHEEDLKKFFGNEFAKDIVSVSMMTDNEARHPTKWAYVSFKTLESSVKALKEKNLQDLYGKPCRLMQYNNDPTFRRTGKGNLFVKNIAPTVTTKELSEFFSQFGEPVSCKVELSNGKSKGYGYVQFSAVEEAEKAITEGNGKELRGQALDIQHFQTQQERSGEMEGTSVYVKGLPINKNFTEEQLKGFFAECGEIKSIQLFRDHSGNLKGSAVVHFGDRDQRAAALNLNEHEFLETKIKVLVYKTKSQLSDERRIRGQEIERMNNERKQRNLFVKNLHPETTEESLREIFSKFGEIESILVKKNEKDIKNDTKMGFVCFKSEEHADAARRKMYQREVRGLVMFVEFVKNHTERTRERESRMPASFGNPYYQMNAGRPVQFMRGGFAPMPYRPRYGGQFPFYPNQAAAFQFIPHDVFRPHMNPRFGGNGRGGYRGGPGHRGSGYPRNMNRNYEVTQRVRNARSTHEQEAAATAAAKTATATQEKQVTTDTTGLAEMSPEEFKNHMGNQIYEEAQKMYESRAGKITGMILDAHDRSSLVEIVQDSNNLQKAIDEAYNYLKEHANQDDEEDDQ